MTEEYRLVKDSVYSYIQVSIKAFAFWLKIKYIYGVVMNACLKEQFRITYMLALFPRPLSTFHHGMGKSHN